MLKNMKNKRITINDLAVMVKRGFDETAKKIDVDQRFDKIDKEIASLKAEVLSIKSDIEDLKLRMGEMVFRFEIKDIEKRLKKLEMKAGLIRR